jgi:hypothetical protein
LRTVVLLRLVPLNLHCARKNSFVDKGLSL